MQLYGKGMGGIHQQADILLAAELFQCVCVHPPLLPDAMIQGQFLPVATSGIVKGLSGLFQCFGRNTAFCSSS